MAYFKKQRESDLESVCSNLSGVNVQLPSKQTGKQIVSVFVWQTFFGLKTSKEDTSNAYHNLKSNKVLSYL